MPSTMLHHQTDERDIRFRRTPESYKMHSQYRMLHNQRSIVFHIERNIQSSLSRSCELQNMITAGARVRLLMNETKTLKSLITRMSQQEENATGVVQNINPLGISLQKFQCRRSASHTPANKQQPVSKGVDFKLNVNRNLHQFSPFSPEVKSGDKTEIREFTCEVAEQTDKDDLVDFICYHFLKREPLMAALMVTPGEARSFVEYSVKDALKDRSSFVTRERETGKVCGVRLNAVGHAEQMGQDVELTPRMRTLTTFLSYVDGLLPEEYQKARFMRHIAICVNSDIARSGVGTLMMEKSVEYSKEHQLKYMVAMCSGKIATRLAEKVGFKTIKQVPYDTYSDPAQSLNIGGCELPTMPFLSLAQEHQCANLMVKEV